MISRNKINFYIAQIGVLLIQYKPSCNFIVLYYIILGERQSLMFKRYTQPTISKRQMSVRQRSKLQEIIKLYHDVEEIIKDYNQYTIIKALPQIPFELWMPQEETIDYILNVLKFSDGTTQSIFCFNKIMLIKHIKEFEENIQNPDIKIMSIVNIIYAFERILEKLWKKYQQVKEIVAWLLINLSVLCVQIGEIHAGQLYFKKAVIFGRNQECWEIFSNYKQNQQIFLTAELFETANIYAQFKKVYIQSKKNKQRTFDSRMQEISIKLLILMVIIGGDIKNTAKNANMTDSLTQIINQDSIPRYFLVKLPAYFTLLLQKSFDESIFLQEKPFFYLIKQQKKDIKKLKQIEIKSLKLNHYNRPLKLLKQTENEQIYKRGYYFEEFLTNQRNQVTLKEQNIHKVYSQLYADDIMFILVDLTLNQNEKNQAKIYMHEHILETTQQQLSVKIIKNFYKNIIILCSGEINLSEQTIEKSMAICVINNPQKMKLKHYKIYKYHNKQQFLKEGLKIMLRQIKSNYSQFPNFSIISGNKNKSKINHSRINLYWMLTPSNKRQSKKNFLNLLQFRQVQLLQQQSTYSIKMWVQDISRQQFRKQYHILRIYSIESFFYKTINRGLRSLNNPLYIPYIRYPITQLYRSIQALHYKQLQQGKYKQQFICYRGFYLAQKQLEIINNVGNYIQMQGFISASMNNQLAKRFGKQIIIIKVPIKKIISSYGSYAVISSYSKHKYEEQVLFNPLNYFKVTKITKVQQKNNTSSSQCQIHLQLVHIDQIKQEDSLSQELVSYHQQNQSIRKNIINQGTLFYNLGDYDKYLQYHIIRVIAEYHRLQQESRPIFPFYNHVKGLLGFKSIANQLTFILEGIINLSAEKTNKLSNFRQVLLNWIIQQQKFRCILPDSILYAYYKYQEHAENKPNKFIIQILEVHYKLLVFLNENTKAQEIKEIIKIKQDISSKQHNLQREQKIQVKQTKIDIRNDNDIIDQNQAKIQEILTKYGIMSTKQYEIATKIRDTFYYRTLQGKYYNIVEYYDERVIQLEIFNKNKTPEMKQILWEIYCYSAFGHLKCNKKYIAQRLLLKSFTYKNNETQQINKNQENEAIDDLNFYMIEPQQKQIDKLQPNEELQITSNAQYLVLKKLNQDQKYTRLLEYASDEIIKYIVDSSKQICYYIGSALFQLKEYNQALKSLHKSIQIYEKFIHGKSKQKDQLYVAGLYLTTEIQLILNNLGSKQLVLIAFIKIIEFFQNNDGLVDLSKIIKYLEYTKDKLLQLNSISQCLRALELRVKLIARYQGQHSDNYDNAIKDKIIILFKMGINSKANATLKDILEKLPQQNKINLLKYFLHQLGKLSIKGIFNDSSYVRILAQFSQLHIVKINSQQEGVMGYLEQYRTQLRKLQPYFMPSQLPYMKKTQEIIGTILNTNSFKLVINNKLAQLGTKLYKQTLKLRLIFLIKISVSLDYYQQLKYLMQISKKILKIEDIKELSLQLKQIATNKTKSTFYQLLVPLLCYQLLQNKDKIKQFKSIFQDQQIFYGSNLNNEEVSRIIKQIIECINIAENKETIQQTKIQIDNVLQTQIQNWKNTVPQQLQQIIKNIYQQCRINRFSHALSQLNIIGFVVKLNLLYEDLITKGQIVII